MFRSRYTALIYLILLLFLVSACSREQSVIIGKHKVKSKGYQTHVVSQGSGLIEKVLMKEGCQCKRDESLLVIRPVLSNRTLINPEKDSKTNSFSTEKNRIIQKYHNEVKRYNDKILTLKSELHEKEREYDYLVNKVDRGTYKAQDDNTQETKKYQIGSQPELIIKQIEMLEAEIILQKTVFKNKLYELENSMTLVEYEIRGLDAMFEMQRERDASDDTISTDTEKINAPTYELITITAPQSGTITNQIKLCVDYYVLGGETLCSISTQP